MSSEETSAGACATRWASAWGTPCPMSWARRERPFGEPKPALLHLDAILVRQDRHQRILERDQAWASGGDVGRDVKRMLPIAQEPLRRMLGQAVEIDEHLDLQMRRHLVVELLDAAP